MDVFAKIYSKFTETIKSRSLVEPGDTVVVSLSGGSDSVALLWLMVTFAEKNAETYPARPDCTDFPARPVTVRAFHFNHMIRGAEADGDEEFCRELAEKAGVPFRAERGDVPAYAAEKGLSLETAAREMRYAALENYARELENETHSSSSVKIAVAHNREDRAETVLFNIIRGTSVDGLAGIRYVNGRIIRPLLDVSKEETYAVCERFGSSFRTDSTNLEPDCARNVLRLEVIPYVNAKTGCDLTEKLLRMSELAEADAAWLEAAAGEAFEKCAREEHGTVFVDCEGFTKLHPALKGRVAVKAISMARAGGVCPFKDGVSVSQSLVQRLSKFAEGGRSGGTIELGNGVFCLKQGKILKIGERAEKPSDKPVGPSSVPLNDVLEKALKAKKRGEFSADFSNGRLTVTGPLVTKKAVSEALKLAKNDSCYAVFDLEKLAEFAADQGGELVLRNPAAGDVFKPFGAPGKKALRRFFTDVKLPAAERKNAVVLASGSTVLHVFGVRGGDFVTVQKQTACGIIFHYGTVHAES